MDENVEVSIICNTFNQEDYIVDAIDSFIKQRTNFKFEILIHDDASNDDTVKIIKEYETKHPDLIKPIYEKENQYSQGISIMDIQINRARGKYIAFCEGDDYWTDDSKLQLQYDILEKHSNIDMVAHHVAKVESVTKKKIGEIIATNEEEILSIEQVISGGGGFVGTNSLFFRKSVLNPKPNIRKKLELDYTIQIAGALKGGIYYIPKVLSAYRICAKGSWTNSMIQNKSRLINSQKQIIDMLLYFNKDSNYLYDATIQETIRKIEFIICELEGKIDLMKSNRYRDLYSELSLKRRIIIRLLKICPGLKNIKHKLFGVKKR